MDVRAAYADALHLDQDLIRVDRKLHLQLLSDRLADDRVRDLVKALLVGDDHGVQTGHERALVPILFFHTGSPLPEKSLSWIVPYGSSPWQDKAVLSNILSDFL